MLTRYLPSERELFGVVTSSRPRRRDPTVPHAPIGTSEPSDKAAGSPLIL